ncbi:MAG: class II aldolase/adducin family protein [Chromatiales bacterium]|jgi:L-fuculose-phosphate aldolase
MQAHEERQNVINLCIELNRRGYLAGTGGNVALRIDSDYFAITPSALDYKTMTADDICVVRLSDLKCISGWHAPSVEMGLHARVLRRRPDVMCSIHTHQPVASACALLGEPLPVDDAHLRLSIGAEVPVIGYMPSGTFLLAGMVGRALRSDVNAYLMRNHGVLCCAENTQAALQTVEDLERLARDRLCSRITAQTILNPQRAAILRGVLALMEVT